jgi:prepilin-type N-terminal cleavage/methylation domain-containing protein
MSQNRFTNALVSHNQAAQSGFTLVEISIVMIIIGLLIGGIFGGMKLIDNANVQKTIQDIRAIESAALTFRDTYRAWPGDIRSPSTRIPNCTVAPCATGGNGNRRYDLITDTWDAITAADERYTFWHHLQGANLLQMDYSNSTVMEFGEGAPSASIGGGYRISARDAGIWVAGYTYSGAVVLISAFSNATMMGFNDTTIPCALLGSVDKKTDDGAQLGGAFQAGYCNDTWPVTASTRFYAPELNGAAIYDLKGF